MNQALKLQNEIHAREERFDSLESLQVGIARDLRDFGECTYYLKGDLGQLEEKTVTMDDVIEELGSELDPFNNILYRAQYNGKCSEDALRAWSQRIDKAVEDMAECIAAKVFND